MANEDRQSEQFIREVDEELRRAQLKAIWDRFAPVIIGACVLVVAVTAGYRGWLWWDERQAAAAGDRFLTALEQVESDPAAGEAELQKIAEEGGAGYAVLARLRLAGERAAAGESADAIAAFDAIAADSSVSASLRALARIRGALLALDTGDLAGARERAAPLDQSGSVWRHPAREVMGTAAYASGDLQGARDYFTSIQQDAETPPELWVRSGWMVALIDGQLAAPGLEDAPSAPETPPSAESPDPTGATDAAPGEGDAAPAPQPPAPAEELPEPEAPAEPSSVTPENPDAEPQTPISPQ